MTSEDKITFVYLVKCADNTLYCGYTNDVSKRIAAHNNAKGAKYTKTRLPVTLVYCEQCRGKSEALKREHQIKKLTREQKLKLCAEFKIENHI